MFVRGNSPDDSLLSLDLARLQQQQQQSMNKYGDRTEETSASFRETITPRIVSSLWFRDGFVKGQRFEYIQSSSLLGISHRSTDEH